MASTGKMLEHIFNSIPAFSLNRRATARPLSESEAIHEDKHTFRLLFPETPYQYRPDTAPASPAAPSPTSATNNDCNPLAIDLESPRDVRIVIAQDDGSPLPRVLYDSKPPGHSRSSPHLQRAASYVSHTRGPSITSPHVRRPSGGATELPARRGSVGSTYQRHARVSSMSSMPNIDEGASARPRGLDSDLKTALECMFENGPQNYKGPSTRIQFVPLDVDSEEAVQSPISSEGFGSFGRIGERRRSQLAMSHTPVDVPRISMSKSPLIGLDERRRTVLVYRLFSVTVPSQQDSPSSSDSATPIAPKLPPRRNSSDGPTKPASTTANVPISSSSSVASSSERVKSSESVAALSLPRENLITPAGRQELNSHGPPGISAQSTTVGSVPAPDISLTPSAIFEHETGFPFPTSRENVPRTRPVRLSMFAVTLIISLPVSHPGYSDSRNGQRGMRRGVAQPEPVILSSSVDSDRQAGWTFVDPVYDNHPQSSDVDDHVDLLGQHWDVIARTLMSLQLVVQESVVSWLRRNNPNALTGNTTSGNSIAGSRTPLKLPQPQRPKRVLLDHFALEGDDPTRRAVDIASSRIVRGLKIPRVRTGQGRWEVWREEVAQLNKYAGGREQNYFMGTLLSVFLGSHIQWLNAFGPKWHRKRHRERKRSIPGEDLTMANRTIIISQDKLLARRLVFLLAAFLPGLHPTRDGTFTSRPGTSASLRGYSQSPPMGGGSMSRQESLRRTINRRDKQRSSQQMGHKPNPLQPQALISKDASSADSPRTHSSQHNRRPSDTRSLLRSGLIAATDVESANRKSAATTTPTMATQTLASFSNATSPVKASHDIPSLSRPGSSSSLASDNLRYTLQRNNSNASDSQSASKWGSFKSMWSMGTRRESSTDLSDVLQYPDEGLGLSGISAHVTTRNKLQRMADEVHGVDGDLYPEDLEESSDRTPAMSPVVDDTEESMFPPPLRSRSRRVPARHQTSVSPPLKMSVNEKDGVIDVEIPGFSFGSPTESFLLNNSNATSSLESSTFGPQSTCDYLIKDNKDARQPVSVSGWIKWVHPDFALQALAPYERLEDDVKLAMAAEPTPIAVISAVSLENGPRDQWVDVCSTVIADTRSFIVKRLTLRRLIRLIPASMQAATTPAVRMPSSKSQWGDVYDKSELTPTELNLEEKFIEERITHFDQDLMEAVEKAIIHCGPEIRVDPARGRREQQQDAGATANRTEPVKQDADKQKLRCRDVILGSLDQIAHDVLTQQSIQRLKVSDSGTEPSLTRQHSRQSTGQRESVLRDGVRRWLREVEV